MNKQGKGKIEWTFYPASVILFSSRVGEVATVFSYPNTIVAVRPEHRP